MAEKSDTWLKALALILVAALLYVGAINLPDLTELLRVIGDYFSDLF